MMSHPLPRPWWATPLLALGAAVSLVAAPSTLAAQPATTITFDELEPPPGTVWQSIGEEYVTAGYRFGCTNSNTGTTCATLGVVGDGGPAYPGSAALYNDNNFGITTLARTNGTPFDLLAIRASPFDASLAGNLVFEGLLAGGGMVSQTFALTGAPGVPVTYTFSDDFRGLAWVRFGGDIRVSAVPVVDELTVRVSSASVVPEPATVALVGGGLLALGGVGAVRRRRAN